MISDAPQKEEKNEEAPEEIRNSILYTNHDTISSIRKTFDQNANLNDNSKDPQFKSFVNEVNQMIENYENEIGLLEQKIDTLQTFDNKLKIENSSNNFSLYASEKLIFKNYVKYLKSKDPSLEEITTIFNEKILELFEENDKLDNELKNFKKSEEDILKLKSLIIDNEHEIKTINELYTQKIEEMLLENYENNEKVKEEFKKSMENSESEHHKLTEEIKQLKLSKNTNSKQNDDVIAKLNSEVSENLNKINNLSSNLSETQKENSSLKEKLTKIEAKLKQSTEENNNLKEIITRDQIRLKELKEHKEHYEQEKQNFNKTIEEFKKEISILKSANSTYEEELKEKVKLEKEKEESAKEIAKRGKVIENLNSAVEKLKVNLKELQEKPVINKLELMKFTKLETQLMVDYTFNLYLYENSINVRNIVQILLNNFNLYMNTIFLRDNDYHLSFSPIHEFLEDIVMKLYDSYIKNTFNDIKANRNSISLENKVKLTKSNTLLTKVKVDKENPLTGKEVWMMNKEDVKGDTCKIICKEILTNNLVTRMASLNQNKKEKGIDEILEMFINKYEKVYNAEVDIDKSNYFGNFIRTELRPIVVDKIEKYKKSLLDEIQTLLEFSLNTFKYGKVIYNNREIYDFKKFYSEYLTKDLRQKESLYVSNSIATPEAIDNLNFTIKHNSKFLKSIFCVGCFKHNQAEVYLGKVTLSLILNCPNIINLSITDSNLDETSIPNIIKIIEFMKSLKILDLSGNSLKENGVKLLGESLKNNKNLVSLNLNNNKIENNGGFYLADSLIKNNALEKLFLAGNRINENSLSSLLSVIGNKHCSVKHLDISDNNLGFEDFKCISEFFLMNSNLTSLNVSNNLIDPVSANYLSLSLKNSNISILHFENNQLNEESSPLLLNYLITSKVKEVYFDNNPFGEVGSILLAHIFKVNKHMKIASLKNCQLTSLSLICICKNLEDNTGLEFLNLEENKFDDQSIQILEKLINSKTNLKVYLSELSLSKKLKDSIKSCRNIIIK